nr:MAG TPA: hypothetical protein [Caudoviricetes sp.]
MNILFFAYKIKSNEEYNQKKFFFGLFFTMNLIFVFFCI